MATWDKPTIDDPIHLHVTEDAFVLASMVYHEPSLRMLYVAPESYEPPKDTRMYEIYGVLGILEGIREKYLVVVTKVQLRGHVLNHPVYVIEKVLCLCFNARKAREKLDARTKVIHITEDSDSEEDSEGIPSDDQAQHARSHVVSVSVSSTSVSSSIPQISFAEPAPPVLRRSNSFMTRLKLFGVKKKGEDSNKEGLTDDESSENGMRYQRRGVNERGQVANFVETEQIIMFKVRLKKVHSYKALKLHRGKEFSTLHPLFKHVDLVRHRKYKECNIVNKLVAVPIFWSQSPYSLHPVPTLERTEEENNAAFAAHFAEQEEIYGRQVAVSLTELSGREAVVGLQYRKHVEHLEFDFHRETKGMRFENISKLSTSLHDDMSKIAYFWAANEDTVYCRQRGVFRTNCMDCLDRTNVVQSAFARNVLNIQLMRFGISEYPDRGIRHYEKFERLFNNGKEWQLSIGNAKIVTVWANNGDMISRMYAGTSALKGDFTRTGKRNITGIMNDASNSLARMYFNAVKDFWRQATVDYILGYHKSEIFRHIPQSALMSAEPGVEKRWAKIRSNAIEISSEIVIADDEVMIAGWTLLSPTEVQKRHSKKFEEKVVLLTAKALYVCSYNYKFEKVMQFKRIGLDRIYSIQVGEYILSSLTPESSTAEQNYGFLVRYQLVGELDRWNTGSIRNQSLYDLSIEGNEKHTNNNESDNNLSDSDDSSSDEYLEDEKAFVVFKAVRYNVLKELPEDEVLNCREQVEDIITQITKACGFTVDPEDGFIKRKAIISLEQAKKMDGIFKKMGYKIKQAIWL
ncbi:hypothetical protein EC973_004846 [Apophysomyces ossiformis]|uniref:Uncharacterized protein n=1 Tax=Apophysomyces ossiformis TaxID=679940 RepID=A0A8H7EM94_9FUNG|nr:hypothetical protein EC973_004846 [Apophysomyces ossiformis]